jgi:hypothetical protein
MFAEDFASRIQYIEYELDDILEEVLRPEEPDPEFGENDPEPDQEEENQEEAFVLDRPIKTEKPG